MRSGSRGLATAASLRLLGRGKVVLVRCTAAPEQPSSDAMNSVGYSSTGASVGHTLHRADTRADPRDAEDCSHLRYYTWPRPIGSSLRSPKGAHVRCLGLSDRRQTFYREPHGGKRMAAWLPSFVRPAQGWTQRQVLLHGLPDNLGSTSKYPWIRCRRDNILPTNVGNPVTGLAHPFAARR
jgi:hypothetical protein